jgi:hypothetical protein
VPIGLGLGAALGLVFGLMLRQLPLGLAVGASVGLVAGAISRSARSVPSGERRAFLTTAVAICVAGAAVLLVILRS